MIVFSRICTNDQCVLAYTAAAVAAAAPHIISDGRLGDSESGVGEDGDFMVREQDLWYNFSYLANSKRYWNSIFVPKGTPLLWLHGVGKESWQESRKRERF